MILVCTLAVGSRREEESDQFGEEQEEEIVANKKPNGRRGNNNNIVFRCKEKPKKVMRTEHVFESVFSFIFL